MRLPLLALVLFAAPFRAADDPPYLAAAKERQAKAKAFEVTLSIKTEWKNAKLIGSDERKDLSGTGTARLAVDGERFWYSAGVPTRNPAQQTLSSNRVEQTCDGNQLFIRFDFQFVKGERAGQFDTQYHVQAASPAAGWEGSFAPLHWAFRATERGGLLADEKSSSLQTTGREEVIGGQRCIEVVRTTTGPHNTSKQSYWFDAESGFVPKRVGRTVVDYVPHPVCGWRPSGWRTTTTYPTTQETAAATVTVESFELRDSIPSERFAVKFPVGSRVYNDAGGATLVVAADGSLVPVPADPAVAPTPPQPELPSVGRTLAVVGGTLALFAGFVVLLKRLARTRPDEPAGGAVP